MKKILSYSVVLFLTLAILYACTSVPITGRKQFNVLPESQLISMSLTEYESFLKENKLSTDAANTKLVKAVGARISKAVEEFLVQNGLGSRVSEFQWEFNLVQDDTPNAWCMPGGKVVFYTGILPYTQSESGIAVVMGHEIAHAVARHGNERMSQQMGIQLGEAALSVALSEKPEQTQNLFLAAYGVGSQVGVMLPFSRSHESEADKMGLIFMAMAGYDPNEAVAFWQRMAQSGGSSTLEILSTHPSDETRITNLKKFIPEAMKYYKAPAK
ncbi:MAG: M48 family metallopeptidase [Breznakibacter sp.]